MKKLRLHLLFLVCQIVILGQSLAQTPEFTVDKILLSNIGLPWGMDFISNTEIIFTEKGGKLKRYNTVSNTTTEITGLPNIVQKGQGGLLDVALHPNFNDNGFVYLTYAVAATGGQTTALGRGELVDNALQNFTELFRALPIVDSDVHFGSRIAFDKQNYVYISIGDRGTPANAQNTNVHAGKIMRLNDDGSVPSDNPLVGTPNTRPEIYSWGHRNIQGMALNPVNGKIYAHEHGPRGGDELNVIKKGVNYGWPAISFGINYNGTPVAGGDTAKEGMEQPLTYWVPSIAPSGLTFLQGSQDPTEFEVLIGALVGTHLHWLKMKNDKKVLSKNNLQNYARFRDVRQASDGQIYALTENPNRLIKIKSSVVTSTDDNTDHMDATGAYITPNPSENGGAINFSLAASTTISLKIIAMNGVATPVITDQHFSAGVHNIELPYQTLQKGVYQVELTKGGTKKLLKWVVL